MRQLSLIDRFLTELDHALKTLHAPAPVTNRDPAAGIQEAAELNDSEKQRSGELMRVNHAGEIAAQGLYSGQALTARLEQVREQMEHAAAEENEHLHWCEKRLNQLNTPKSLLNPVWYWGAFSMGALAGLAGDRWSLGFVKETEEQVGKHLDKHLAELPANDLPSIAILKVMKEDELRHGAAAEAAGGKALPLPIRKLAMPAFSKVMTTLSKKI